MDEKLIKCLQTELDLYISLGLQSVNLGNQTTKWKDRVAKEPARFIKSDGKLDIENIENFRRLNIFLEDWPNFKFDKLGFTKYSGYYRAYRKWLVDTLSVVKEYKYEQLLEKYPCNSIGNPYTFRYSGYSYTFRWMRQIYQLGLMKKAFGNLLKDDFVALDLGSGYGIFSAMAKGEFPNSHHILVDFPEALLLAYYYLGTCFPNARIAGIKEIHKKAEITRSFVDKYDFVLIPVTFYQRLEKETVDIYTNFVSLGEMKREWFDYYLKSAPFLTAKYFYTINRIISQPAYDTDITLLDYIVHRPKNLLHFAIHPLPSGLGKVKFMFLTEKITYPPLFEYICEM